MFKTMFNNVSVVSLACFGLSAVPVFLFGLYHFLHQMRLFLVFMVRFGVRFG
jgi:hypothetical protein